METTPAAREESGTQERARAWVLMTAWADNQPWILCEGYLWITPAAIPKEKQVWIFDSWRSANRVRRRYGSRADAMVIVRV